MSAAALGHCLKALQALIVQGLSGACEGPGMCRATVGLTERVGRALILLLSASSAGLHTGPQGCLHGEPFRHLMLGIL